MKKIYIIILIIFTNSCAINNKIKIEKKYDNIFTNLELIFEDKGEVKNWVPGQKIFRDSNKFASIFYNTMETNLINTNNEKINGYIKVKPIKIYSENINYWLPIMLATMWISPIIGLPINTFDGYAKISVKIFDNKNNLIKEYITNSKATIYCNIYGNIRVDNCHSSIAEHHAFKKATEEAIKQIHNDKTYLMEKLK